MASAEEAFEIIKQLSIRDQWRVYYYLLSSDLINDLKKFKDKLNPPCDKNQILALEEDFAIKLPHYLIHIYENYDGMKWRSPLPFRLMSLEEVRKTRQEMAEWWRINEDICLFWSDDQGNFAGLYLKGYLEDKICFIDHEETDVSPVFKNIFTFYKTLFNAQLNKQDWYEMPTDYPILINDKDNPTHSKDYDLARTFIYKYHNNSDEDEKRIAAFNAMNLTPLSKADIIYSFAESDDMWTQGRACEILGKRKDENAVLLLAKIAREGTHNGRIAAMSSLRKIVTDTAKSEIIKLRQELGKEWSIYLKD